MSKAGKEGRAEYDFSGGVRGKHAARLADGRNVVHDPDGHPVEQSKKECQDVIAAVRRGIEDMKAGRVSDAEEVFDDIEKRFGIGK